MWAVYWGHLEVVKVLVQAGADKEKQSVVGSTICVTIYDSSVSYAC
jgi:hypothetical protein